MRDGPEHSEPPKQIGKQGIEALIKAVQAIADGESAEPVVHSYAAGFVKRRNVYYKALIAELRQFDTLNAAEFHDIQTNAGRAVVHKLFGRYMTPQEIGEAIQHYMEVTDNSAYEQFLKCKNVATDGVFDADVYLAEKESVDRDFHLYAEVEGIDAEEEIHNYERCLELVCMMGMHQLTQQLFDMEIQGTPASKVAIAASLRSEKLKEDVSLICEPASMDALIQRTKGLERVSLHHIPFEEEIIAPANFYLKQWVDYLSKHRGALNTEKAIEFHNVLFGKCRARVLGVLDGMRLRKGKLEELEDAAGGSQAPYEQFLKQQGIIDSAGMFRMKEYDQSRDALLELFLSNPPTTEYDPFCEAVAFEVHLKLRTMNTVAQKIQTLFQEALSSKVSRETKGFFRDY